MITVIVIIVTITVVTTLVIIILIKHLIAASRVAPNVADEGARKTELAKRIQCGSYLPLVRLADND